MRAVWVVSTPLLVALGTVIFQKFLAWASRRSGQPRFTREDYLFWSDWLAAGLVAMLILSYGLVRQNQSQTIGQFWALLFVLAVNFGLPQVVREQGYDASSPPHLRTWHGIILPNVVAVVTMTVAVASGLNLEITAR